MRIMKALIHRFGTWYIKEKCKSEYESQQFQYINERPIEYRFALESLLRIVPCTVLDVGSGITAFPQLLRNCGFLVTAIDNIQDYWGETVFNRHFHVINEDITHTNIKKRFDFITCISVIEHIQNHEVAIQAMFRLLKKGGHLVLTFPYNKDRQIENVYKLTEAGYGHDLPYICKVYSQNNVDSWLKNNKCKIVLQEY